jgi:phytanoyl-CoA hydroxylase
MRSFKSIRKLSTLSNLKRGLTSHLTRDQIYSFRENGYLVVPNFIRDKVIDEMKTRIHKIQKKFDPSTIKLSIFTSTVDDDKHIKDDYFYDSSDKISFFLEDDAVDKVTGKLKYPIESSLNKIGHALHDKDAVFREFSFRTMIRNYCKDLGMDIPTVVQSMYIFKGPQFGGEVTPHQDSTFLYTENDEAVVVGFWFALEDANVDNGCLWGLPGSHKNGLQNRWERTPNGPKFLPKKPELAYETTKWDDQYVPIEVKKGSAVLLHGHFVHRSHKNVSMKPRDAYAIHVVDFRDKWAKENWIQRSDGFPQYWK